MSTAHKKASLLQKVSKGLTVGSVITGSTFLHGPPVLALGFTKLFKKSKKVDETNIQLANSWIGVNNHLIEKVLPNLKWDMGIGSSTAPILSAFGCKAPRGCGWTSTSRSIWRARAHSRTAGSLPRAGLRNTITRYGNATPIWRQGPGMAGWTGS
nr:hypothetical protein BICADAIG_00036 [Acinetobacter sp.]